jgi:hypothetical protein
METRRQGQGWSNDIVATMTPLELAEWRALWAGLQPVTEMVTLQDLTALHVWAPRIRRFSFVMSPAAKPIKAESP